MENVNFWINIIISVLTGIATCVPVVIRLIQVVKDAVKAKNWTPLMQIILRLMSEAEKLYTSGADKKEYVMSSIKAMEDTLQYDVDEDTIGTMIDSIVLASKTINADKK